MEWVKQGFTSAGAMTCAALLVAGSGVAQEQNAPATEPPSEAPADISEVVVTGSRISRSGFTAPTPVTMLGAERLQERGISHIGEALNELPSFRASVTPATVQNTGGNVGARILDLRGLGPERTLVLVDGKRFVPSTPRGTIDTNLIPSALIERVEVVTGGASAAYGSDAVAGVVNFILAEKLDEVRASTHYGKSAQGDDESFFASLAAGSPFLEDRGHWIGAVEYQNDQGIGDCYERSWCGAEWLNLGNAPAGTAGRPANNITNDVHTATFSQDGVINSASASFPLRGLTFNADGSTRPFQYGEIYGTSLTPLFMKGGEGRGENTFIDGFLLKPPVKRYALYTQGKLDLASEISALVSLSYGRVDAQSFSNQYRDNAGSLGNPNSFGPIRSGNPFIPASVQATMTQNAIPTFTLGRSFGDIGNAAADTTNETLRVVAGLNGKLGGSWSWDAYYQFGDNDFRQNVTDNVVISRMRNAMDAVRDPAGAIVCAINNDANPANDDPACAPFNAFGRNRFSPEAEAYVAPPGFQTTSIKEHVVAANVQADPFSTWAGPVSLAGGAELRRDKIAGDADPISQVNGFFVLNGQRLAGEIDVTEGYLETVVPLADELPFARSLELNAAVRRTHYSRSSPDRADSSLDVTTWKVGSVWSPVDTLRFRATRSRDVRAPNLAELFGPQLTATSSLTDPATGGRQSNPALVSGSNPSLVPEVADTWTAGLVFQPGAMALGTVQMSLDYYEIEVDKAIGTLGAQTIVTRCFQGAAEFCPLIDRDPQSNEVIRIRDLLLNVNGLATSGFDFEAAYRTELGDRFGSLDVRALVTYVEDLITLDSAGATDRAGQTGWRAATQPGVPEWLADTSITWRMSRSALTLHTRYVPAGTYHAAFVGPTDPGFAIALPNSSNINRVEDAFYTDLSGQLRLQGTAGASELTLFAGLSNVFDVEPPLAPSGSGNGNFILFDPSGRSWRLGVRASF
jgi:iron complex outermembrane recepter protein